MTFESPIAIDLIKAYIPPIFHWNIGLRVLRQQLRFKATQVSAAINDGVKSRSLFKLFLLSLLLLCFQTWISEM